MKLILGVYSQLCCSTRGTRVSKHQRPIKGDTHLKHETDHTDIHVGLKCDHSLTQVGGLRRGKPRHSLIYFQYQLGTAD